LDYEEAQDRIVPFQDRQVLANNLSMLNTDQEHTGYQTNSVTDSDFFVGQYDLWTLTEGEQVDTFSPGKESVKCWNCFHPQVHSLSFTILMTVFSFIFFHLSVSLLLTLLHF
jgi:hypothetical protein